MIKVLWHRFGHQEGRTCPPVADEYWVVERFYYDGVVTARWTGRSWLVDGLGDDCCVTHWAFFEYPEGPDDGDR